MPSLFPKTRQQRNEAPDVRRVFYSDECRPSLDRAARFIGSFEAQFSNRPFELLSTGAYVEEFFLTMPTIAAWKAELELCAAIDQHSGNLISDDSLRKIIEKKYFFSHIFLYKNSSRETREGEWLPWIDTPLYYLTSPRQQTGNVIQTLLAIAIERVRGNMAPVNGFALK